jgi:hypothetical protein
VTRESIIAISAITFYIVWLIVFVLVIERWLRRLTEWIFGITITREINRVVGQAELLDALFIFGWKVAEPAGLSLRFAVGLLRITFWLLALTLPPAIGIAVYLRLSR